jgi:hypothetical protein
MISQTGKERQMLNNRYFFNFITLGLLLIGTAPTIAQSTGNSPARSESAIARVYFKPPPDDKEPDRTTGAGSRGGQCPQDAAISTANTPPLMALVPTTNKGLTLAERPTFWVYLPKTFAKQVVLSIREEGTKDHSQTFFPITETSGLISLTPPPNSPPLEVGKTYQWAVVLVCGERPSPNDPAIASWVRRVAPSQPTNQGTALEQAAWYGEQGIWYDALDSLAEARRTQANNKALAGIWTDFLNSVGLEVIATEPLQSTISPNKH